MLITILVVLTVPLLILLINTIVSKPLPRLTKAMRHIQEGDLDFRVKPGRASSEIQVVNQTFNHMIDQVQNLKISVYENEIKVQRTQLRNLQLQIKPHFLINSLNMVFNLIDIGEYPTARKLIRYSVDYFRYMVKVDEDLVPLKEEISHVEAYLEIQSIRYQNQFSYDIQVDPLLSDTLIPPSLIQGFVENSMKYAIRLTEPIHIQINAESFESDAIPYAKIRIADTGNGYPSDQLEFLNKGKKITDKNGEHVGIRNSVQRLGILFDGKAKWKFYNNDGAVSELTLPEIFDR